jgi:hypothetical protein
MEFRSLLIGLPAERQGLVGDPDLINDVRLLEEYLRLLQKTGVVAGDTQTRLADSLRYAGRLKVLPAPQSPVE